MKNILRKMTTTFFSQRKDITSGTEVVDLEREWLYLFEPCGMRSRFKELTGVDVTKEAIESRSEGMVSFLTSFKKRNKTDDSWQMWKWTNRSTWKPIYLLLSCYFSGTSMRIKNKCFIKWTKYAWLLRLTVQSYQRHLASLYVV